MAGAQCCENPPALDAGSGGGAVVEFGGLSSYVVGDTGSRLAVLIVSDIFGNLMRSYLPLPLFLSLLVLFPSVCHSLLRLLSQLFALFFLCFSSFSFLFLSSIFIFFPLSRIASVRLSLWDTVTLFLVSLF